MTAFVPLRAADAACGSKAVVLGKLLRTGFAVPNGFVLPVDSGAGWEQELPGVLDALDGSSFAVRSSGMAEDGHESSYAGQFHTSLDVPSAEVEDEVRRTAVAVEEARAYATVIGQPAADKVAVIVQRMLSPAAAGVAFTRDPVTGRRSIVIEAVHGLGDQLVSGQAHPERWRITPGNDPRCLTTRKVLNTEQATKVSRVAALAEKILGGPQDVEWAIADGQVWVLQARPITAISATENATAAAPSPDATTTAVGPTFGTPASPGTAHGRLRIIEGLDDFSRFATGEVLVCRATSPAWTPLLVRAAAVVTTRGGLLSHAAIIARELRIPAITDVPSAMGLPDGARVHVDGTAGTITALEESR
ncbi:pyruvate, water dikinase [Arthrobacter crystallopoietes BAB-32]|uniref:Pyruvate, water dikinase n=1 Tax=Arthrobacter crystallopoietes BAB-32 TaxID=1246476 RepID=N1V2G9_9MICC|nr:PEP/pyruvate-binding domain-containing protein [Arthrobacter crystallopoietes]EMY32448.1 pyruvate, water dikinase [Arthrobacter crystallopoietes BAB-32]